MDIRIATINLAGVSDGWFEGRREAMVEQLAELGLDALCLQEVASRGSPYPYDQVADLAARLGLSFACFAPYGNPDEVRSRERGGVALIARWPFRWVEVLQLPPGSVSPDARVAALGTLAHPEGLVHLLGTHLSWPLDAHQTREDQVRHALDRVRDLGWDRPGARFVLAGDLNGVEGEPALRLVSERLIDAYRAAHPTLQGLTWTRANPLVWYDSPDRRVDYLFADRGATVLAAEVALDRAEAPASDHYAVFAHLRWDGADRV
ncbi:MAG TPA: endonuclease/exonuclease/phosphatase family protein [Pantanalinema sp.]